VTGLGAAHEPKLRIDVLGVPGIDQNIQLNAYLEGHPCTDGMMLKEGSCGYMILGTSRDAPYLFVIGVRVAADARRQLIGTRLYEKAAEIAAQYGLPLASDTSRTPSAEGLWKKQQRLGRARAKRPFGNKIYVLDYPAPKSLAGYIDEHGIGEGWQHIWLGPDGEDISVVDHEQYARQQGAGGRNPNIEFERQGWIRISIYAGAISVELETEPTPAQVETLAKYLSYPGIAFRAANYRNRYLQADGFTRMTAGQIAAWAQGQAGGGLGAAKSIQRPVRHIDSPYMGSSPLWAHIWVSPEGLDTLYPDHKVGAVRVLRSLRVKPNDDAQSLIAQLLTRGYLRMTLSKMNLDIEAGRPLTPAQVRTLQDYLAYPGVAFSFAEVAGLHLWNRELPSISAGRIAAWVAQVAQ